MSSSSFVHRVYVRLYQDGSSARLAHVGGRWELTATDARGTVEGRYPLPGMLAAVLRTVDAIVRRPAKTAWIVESE